MELSSVECLKCHAEMFEGARFCIKCGSALDGAPSVVTRTVTSRPPGQFSALLSPPNPVAKAAPASLSEAMGQAMQQAHDESWSAPAPDAAQAAEIIGDTRALSLVEMAADLAAVATKAEGAGT